MSIELRARDPDVSLLNELGPAVTRVALQGLERARESRFDGAGLETLRLAVEEARSIGTRRAILQTSGKVTSAETNVRSLSAVAESST